MSATRRPRGPKRPVSEYMTAGPTCVRRHDTFARAHDCMARLRVRHLPVVDERGGLEGVVSERDLYALERYRDVNPEVIHVEEAMMPTPYHVPPDAPLGEVAQHMLDEKLGSAVVVDAGKVVGVFTTSDALRALCGHAPTG